MRQNHTPGDKLFVDYAGDKLPVVDRLTGETRGAHIFVGVLGASSLSYAEATWTETLPDWIGANVRAVEAFGGAPALFVPGNAVAVIKACLYDPQVNRSYAAMAAHYGSAVLPTRPRRPRDKAKVEAAVLIVERWLFGRLRHRIFYSLAELNAAITDLIAGLNDRRVLRRVGVTRRQLFEELDRPALTPLPVEPYVYAEWRRRRDGLARLSCRDRAPLLLGAVPLCPRADRTAGHRADHRAVPSGRAGRRSHGRRQAAGSEEPQRFVFEGTPINEGLVRSLHAGSFLANLRNVVLVGGTGTGKTHLAVAVTAIVVRAGTRGRYFNTVDHVSTSYPRTADQHGVYRHGESLWRAYRQRRGRAPNHIPSGWRCCSTGNGASGTTASSPPGCGSPGCVIRRRLRTSTIGAPVGSLARC